MKFYRYLADNTM